MTVQASARVRSELGPDGRSRLVHVAGAPPLVPRATGPWGVHLVGAAGGPLPGDRTCLELQVEDGAVLVVASTAATIALPGADPALPASRHEVLARVGRGGLLVVLGRPLVAARGSRHEVSARIELAPYARLVWRDLLVPGRTGEPSGRLTARLRVTREGAPVLDTALSVGPEGSAGLGAARCAGSLALVGCLEGPALVRRYGPDAAVLPLAAPAAVLGSALGAAHDVDRQLRAMAADLVDADVLPLVQESW